MAQYRLARFNRAAEKIVPTEVKSFDTWEEMCDYVSDNYLVSSKRASWPRTGRIELFDGEMLAQVAFNK